MSATPAAPPDNAMEYQYDVGFSFLQQDESIALQLKALLSHQFSVFVYSERQRELAGKDGMDTFTDVFAKQARVCVILFRDGWGETRWTRIEETAVKNRAFESGWDFLLVIALDLTPTRPKWLPATKIWLGWEQFGASGATAVIHARVTEAGGVARDESPLDKATRMAQCAREEQALQRRLRSDEGVALARASVDELFAHIHDAVNEIIKSARPKTSSPDIRYEENRQQPMFPAIVVRTARWSVTVHWAQQYANSLDGSALTVTRFAGAVFFDGFTRGRRELTRRTYSFRLDAAGLPVWVNDKTKDELVSSPTLADQELRWLIGKQYGE